MDTSAIARIKAHYSGDKERLTLDSQAIAYRSAAKIGDPFSSLVLNLYYELMRSDGDFLAAGVHPDEFKLVHDRYASLMPIRTKRFNLSTYIDRYPAIEEVEADIIELMSTALNGSRRQGYLLGVRVARASRILTIREMFNSLTVLHPRLQDLFTEVVDVRDPNKPQDSPWTDASIRGLFTNLINARDNVFLDYSSDTLQSYCDEVRATLEHDDLRTKIESDGGQAAWSSYRTKIEQMMTNIEVETMLDRSLTE